MSKFTEEAKHARAAYAREYRRKHPERVKAAQERYWRKKFEEQNKKDMEVKVDENQ